MFNREEFIKRRNKLYAQMRENSVAIIFSATECIRSADTYFPYRQDSDFYYLTGFNEPESAAVFIKNKNTTKYFLFNRIRDPEREQWDGTRAGQVGACENFAADKAFPVNEINERLFEILRECNFLYYDFGKFSQQDLMLTQTMNNLKAKNRNGEKIPNGIFSLTEIIHEMRLKKSPYEIELMRKAATISAQAHIHAMEVCKPDMMEYQLEATLSHDFIFHGCRAPAYTPIVGSGANSCILHYIKNDSQMKAGDLVLIDAGGEYYGYASDITRTFPVNGKFSPEQKIIYEIVLQAQLKGIEQVRPGVSWVKIQEAVIREITKGLIEVKILQGELDSLIEKKSYLPFYMHNSGHWLGLDTHDVGAYKKDGQWRNLETGMVLTVEPGIYISSNLKNVDYKWHNIGVRIEDDVLVTENGCEVLSKDAPKTVASIEALMSTQGCHHERSKGTQK